MTIDNKILGTIALAAALAVPGLAGAADCPDGFPSGPINFIVGYGAGGGTDAIARSLAAAIESQQGWTMVVDNKPGAGGGVMSAGLMVADPDGYTVGLASTDTIALNPIQGDSPYSAGSFDYLGSAMRINIGLVALADKPYNDVAELVAYAKEKGRATVSVAGVNQEYAVKKMGETFGVNLIPVPGKGAADALKSALGGHVDATSQGTQHVQQIRAGKMKQLASMTGSRVPYAPDSKTLREQGVDVALDVHTILFAPKGLDSAVKTCLTEAVDEATKSDTYGELMAKFDNEALNLGPDGVSNVINDMTEFYKVALDKG
jgi:tripartite-type tricarboxylate transporter receptor subunit TctC